MSLWDSIKQQFANFGAGVGQFMAGWWPLLALLAIVAIVVGWMRSEFRRAPLDPEESKTAPLFPGWYDVLDEAEMVLEQCVHFYEVEHAEQDEEVSE